MPKKNRTSEEICADIKKLIEESEGLTSAWQSNQETWHKMRMRIKKTKTFPFIGCANIRMPTVEIKLRKVKAALANIIFGIRPIVQVIPNPGARWETAVKIEKFLDHILMDVMKIRSKAIIAIDQMLEKGFFLLKPYWKTDIVTRTEKLSLKKLSMDEAMWLFAPDRNPEEVKMAIAKKYDVDMNPLVSKENMAELDRVYGLISQGKSDIDTEFQDVLYDFPEIALCEPERVYVPTDSGYNPQDNSWICHEYFMHTDSIESNVKTKGWDGSALNEIYTLKERYNETDAKRDKNIDTTKELREGISTLDETGKIKIWEFYGWYDINNDGVNEKAVVTIAPDFNQTLRKISLPFYSGKYPFVKLFYELSDDRWFSHRGIPELLEDVVKEIDMQHNQKLDQQTIRNTPMFVHRAGMVNKNTIQFIFGQSIPVHGMQPLGDVIAPLNNSNTNVEYSYEREQMILETKIEELIGQVDFSLQSMINKRQPRTLGEVQMQQQNMQMVFSLDAEVCRMQFEELFRWVWELWCQYGPDNYEFMYFGKDGYEPIKLTKEECQNLYKVTVRGNDQNTNPQVRIQKAQQIMAGMANQLAVQMGVITPMNMANAYKRIYQELDIPNWEELVSKPTPQPPAPVDVAIGMEDLTDAEASQVLAQHGIRPDVQGRQLRSSAIIQDKQEEQKGKAVENYSKITKAISELEEKKETARPAVQR